MVDKREENIPAAVDPDHSDAEERRGFLIKSGALLAALGMAGLGGSSSVFAQERMSKEDAKTLQTTLNAAMKGGNMERALAAEGKALPADVRTILGKLTASDLRAAASLNNKLAGLKDKLADGNNGYVGM